MRLRGRSIHGTLARSRCFLANSVEQRDLPSDLSGVISIPVEEPADLASRKACAQSIRGVSAILKDTVQRMGRSPARRPMFYESDELSGTKRDDFYASIDNHMAKYFPDIHDEVRAICIEGASKHG